jgi:hypothetical protein
MDTSFAHRGTEASRRENGKIFAENVPKIQ